MIGPTLSDDLFASKAMREVFSARATVQAILDFEAALARAEADEGLLPTETATLIAAQCRAKRFDLERLAQEGAAAGSVAIPLVLALTDLVARTAPEAAHFVHFGATSQDALDTGLMLQLAKAFELFDTELEQLSDALAELVRSHRRTVMLGRTWLRPTVPITFGIKAAGWLSATTRCRHRLREIRARALVVQFGGAAGTLASLGERGVAVATRLGQALKLGVPDLPWHTTRDRLVEVGAGVALVAGTLGKIARDLSLLTQPEVGEASGLEASGRNGFSTLSRRQIPVRVAAILAVATRVPGLVATLFAAMPQEHERGVSGWHVESESLPEICLLTSGALMHALEGVRRLEVEPERMRANVDAMNGGVLCEAVALALVRHFGRPQAHALVERAWRQAVETKTTLREALESEREVRDRFTVAELEELCDPMSHLGSVDELTQRVLAEHQQLARVSEG